MNKTFKKQDVLVLTSGGQDSTTCLYWAIKSFKRVYAISFDYGQKHVKEIKIAAKLCRELGIEHKTVDISFMKNLVESNLFAGADDVNANHILNKDVPSSFVPYRNMIFLTLAAAWASTLNVRNIVTGVCETDYSGYADCRDVFIKSLQASLCLATDFKNMSPVIHTPLMWLTKAEEFKLAEELGCLDIVINDTLTCYNGVLKKNYYGRGCGGCPACVIRQKGYDDYMRTKNEK